MTKPPSRARRNLPTFAQWAMFGGLVFLVVVLKLAGTKHSIIVAKNTTALWVSVLTALVGVIILRSGWGVSAERTDKQLEFGTVENSFYQPRREAFVQGATIFGGVTGALWWGVQSWILLFTGMRRHQAVRGLWDFEMSILVGAVAGAVVGATVGLIAGHVWEQRHRKKRRTQQ